MATLDDKVKLFIVKALACYDMPTVVAQKVKEEFGLEIGRQQISAYDPNRAMGAQLSKKWRVVFEETRARFKADISEIPIASSAYRLSQLSRLYELTANKGNVVVAAQLLEQAAKEAGGSFTNRRELSGPGGAPIETKTDAPVTKETVREILDDLRKEF